MLEQLIVPLAGCSVGEQQSYNSPSVCVWGGGGGGVFCNRTFTVHGRMLKQLIVSAANCTVKHDANKVMRYCPLCSLAS